jgi:membrane-bound ClpP family serine protease
MATTTTAFILLPVSVHRRLFRKRLKETLVSSADTITKIALAGVAMLSVGTAALVFDVTAGRSVGLIAGGVLLAILLVLLIYVPLRLSRRAAGK